MSGSGKPLLYWDACLWIAYLSAEKRPGDEMLGVKEHVRMFEAGEAICVTSVLTLSEILHLNGQDAEQKVNQVFQRRIYQPIEVSKEIGLLARKIRAHYLTQPTAPGAGTIRTPDAIHLATAIAMKCDSLFTFDGLRDPNAGPRQVGGLLKLNGQKIAGQYDLRILVPPEPPQIKLPLGTP